MTHWFADSCVFVVGSFVGYPEAWQYSIFTVSHIGNRSTGSWLTCPPFCSSNEYEL